MTTNLFLEAFGTLDPSTATVVDEAEKDLYGVFRERADLLGWSTPSESRYRCYGICMKPN